MTKPQRRPREWGPRKRARQFARIITSMAVLDTGEQSLWCAVVCQAARDTTTQNHDPGWWRSDDFYYIAEVLGLRPSQVYLWAKRSGVDL